MDNPTQINNPNPDIPVEKPVAPVYQKPKFNNLQFILTILVCFLVFGFGGYYLGQKNSVITSTNPTSTNLQGSSPAPTINIAPTPDATADWETYTNTENGY